MEGKEMSAEAEKEIILEKESGAEPKKDEAEKEEEGKTTIPQNQTELLQQINMKMDALLAANNISL